MCSISLRETHSGKYHTEWDFATSAMEGASYYKLPRLLQWFSGNIGFHHIHHLNPRTPNYKLQRCHEENASSSKSNRSPREPA